MLKDLEEHIINAGLADMVATAETITTVRAQTLTQQVFKWQEAKNNKSSSIAAD